MIEVFPRPLADDERKTDGLSQAQRDQIQHGTKSAQFGLGVIHRIDGGLRLREPVGISGHGGYEVSDRTELLFQLCLFGLAEFHFKLPDLFTYRVENALLTVTALRRAASPFSLSGRNS